MDNYSSCQICKKNEWILFILIKYFNSLFWITYICPSKDGLGSSINIDWLIGWDVQKEWKVVYIVCPAVWRSCDHPGFWGRGQLLGNGTGKIQKIMCLLVV